jgi:hypothetical protein
MTNHIDGASIEVEPRHEKSWRVKTATRQVRDTAADRAVSREETRYFGMAQLLAPAAGR